MGLATGIKAKRKADNLKIFCRDPVSSFDAPSPQNILRFSVHSIGGAPPNREWG